MPPGVSVGLVPFVKNHYREMLREHARLKQQLLVQFQQNKKKKGSSSSKTKRRSAKPSPPGQQFSAQAIERVRGRGDGQASTYLTEEESRALRYGTRYAPASAVRKALARWTDLIWAGGEAEEAEEAGARQNAVRAPTSQTPVFKSPYAGTDYATMTQADSELLRYLLIKAVGRFCQFWSRSLMKSCEVEGSGIMRDAIMGRDEGQALITVSNHASSIDDPFVTSVLVPDEALEGEGAFRWPSAQEAGPGSIDDAVNSNKVRWVMCATDRCFKSKLASSFFKAVQALPVERGSGLNQPSMRVASKLLSRGGWVHVFPEGTRSTTGELLKMKVGVGQLVVNVLRDLRSEHQRGENQRSRTPMIVPYYHEGMGDLLGKGMKFSKVGTSLRVVVGDPIEIEDLVRSFESGRLTEREVRIGVLRRVETALHQLKRKSEDADYLVTYNDPNLYSQAGAGAGAYRERDDVASEMEAVRGMWGRLRPLAVLAALEREGDRGAKALTGL